MIFVKLKCTCDTSCYGYMHDVTITLLNEMNRRHPKIILLQLIDYIQLAQSSYGIKHA